MNYLYTAHRKRKTAQVQRAHATCAVLDKEIRMSEAKLKKQARAVTDSIEKQPGIGLKREASQQQWELEKRIEKELQQVQAQVDERVRAIKLRSATLVHLFENESKLHAAETTVRKFESVATEYEQ